MQFMLTKQNIVKSLTFIYNNQYMRQSQSYLDICEKQAKFPFILLQIIEQLQQCPLRLQAFTLFVNVLKRNWLSSRKVICVVNLDQEKANLKSILVKYYKINFPYSKCLDDIVRFISKNDYPNEWIDLHNYFLQILQNIVNQTLNYNKKMLRELQIIKNVLRQQAKKRSFINKKTFLDYTAHLLKFLLQLFQNINIKLTNSLENNQTLSSLEFQISRNIDQNILYILLTLNPQMQDNEEVADILSKFLVKIDQLFKSLSICKNQIERQVIQKCLKSNLKNLGNIQGIYPFSFTKFLIHYQNMLLSMLKYNKYLTNEYVIKFILINLCKILKTFNYYVDQETFKSSIVARSSKKNYYMHQVLCHQQFNSFFNPKIIEQLFNLLILEIFSYKHENSQQIFEEQQLSDISESENSIHTLGSILLYQIIYRFKNQSMKLIQALLINLVQDNFRNSNNQVNDNIYIMLFLLPKVFSAEQLPLNIIFKVFQNLFKIQDRMFAILVSKYTKIFTTNQLQSILNSLIEISLNQKSNIICKYESISAIKKILNQHDEKLDLTNLSKVLGVLVSMFDKFENPSQVWNLVSLTNKIMEQINFDENIILDFLNSSSLRNLIYSKSSLLINPITELLQNIITKTHKQEAFLLIFGFIKNNCQCDLEDIKQNLYSLLLTCVQIYSPEVCNLQNQFLFIFSYKAEDIKNKFPFIYIQLLEEQVILNFIKWSNQTISNIIYDVYIQNRGDIKVKCACLQFYFTLMQIRPIEYNRKIIQLVFSALHEITDTLSTEYNLLRSNLMNIINRYIISNYQEFIKMSCQMFSITKDQFQILWLSNIQYLSSKFAFKLNSLAILTMLEHININNTVFQTLIKIILIQLEPLQQPKHELNKKIKGISRRKQLWRKNNQFSNLDLRPLFSQKIFLFKQKYSLNDDFFIKNIKSAALLSQLQALLTRTI